MIWTRSPAFFGGTREELYFTSDTEVGDLWDYMGQPTQPLAIEIIVDACDVANIVIPVDFNSSCTFQLTAINDGRFIGKGGNGGAGADDYGATGGQGVQGNDGGHAITVNTFAINLNIDDGFCLGGGGGGGGGGFNDEGTTGDPGGGGGGGQGWGTSTGGAAGTPSGTPVAQAGSNGSVTIAGSGGLGGGGILNMGGDGGTWGTGGGYGQAPTIGVGGEFSQPGLSGAGGDAGCAVYPINGASVTLNGVTPESNLRSSGRLLGETQGKITFGAHITVCTILEVGGPTSGTSGWRFENDGVLYRINDHTDAIQGSGPISNAWWIPGTITGADYDVLDTTVSAGGSWTVEPTGTANTWRNINVDREWNIQGNVYQRTQLFQIRRNSNQAIQASGWIKMFKTWEP